MTIRSREGSRMGAGHSGNIRYSLEDGGSYRIDAYDEAPAFSSFLPGIAGVDGVPLWCMYVNRAQAVVSFGVESKDRPIAEFLPVPWAYQLVGVQGFRTFCKIDGEYYEPFQEPRRVEGDGVSRSMRIGADRVSVSEINQEYGLHFSVEYFSPVDQPIGSLVRRLRITNSSGFARHVSVLDGLPILFPSGVSDFGAKALRRIHEAYATVSLAQPNVPFYSTRVVSHDEAEVVRVDHGNFYAAWVLRNSTLIPVDPVVDPDVVFGAGNDLITPRRFIGEDQIDRAAQTWENRLPCALIPFDTRIEAGASATLVAVIGHAPNKPFLSAWLGRFRHLPDLDAASAESARVVSSVTAPALTVSSSPTFDAYSRQNYLDNVLRGGVPLLLPSTSGPTPLHLYSRRHGDLERDYNHFVVPAHPLSSGAGNYRDVCQNRRWDVWFSPDLGDAAIRMFVELLQADGFNPLSIDGYRWVVPENVDPAALCPASGDGACAEFCSILQRPFHPGELLNWTQLHHVDVEDSLTWLSTILKHCGRVIVANGHEGGFWTDHWTYIVDLLEAFAGLYPDQVGEMLTGRDHITWFDDGARVSCRDDKYGMRSSGPRQISAVSDRPVSRDELPPVTVLGKLCALIAVKAVSFDFECKGIEMEAGRPGWNDSLNGLPSLFGSSSCEAAEVARLSEWLRLHAPENATAILPIEVSDFVDEVVNDLEAPDYSWDRASGIREAFRRRVYAGASGTTREVSHAQLQRLLVGAAERARTAVQRSIEPETGLCHTYYIGEPVLPGNHRQSPPHESGGDQLIVTKFRQKPLPLYLEGQVHYLRLLNGPDQARRIYHGVRESALFDNALKMYKINENLVDCPPEIGRARTFTRGWYENESIWLHMSYKYLLELLRAGLHDEFFEDAKTMLVPFMDPAVYGRSILENSSFLGSSANPDRGTHGRGFVVRLSGSTAEFIHMWLLLTVGGRPFFMEDGDLQFGVKPVLPGTWFTRKTKSIEWKGQLVEIRANSFCCAALGSILLVYQNASLRDTFGAAAARPIGYLVDGNESYEGPTLGPEVAARIRRRKVNRIDVELA